jgi:hypothetical protein
LTTDPAAADPHAVYQGRLVLWRERIAALDRTHLLISNARLGLALAGAVLVWLAFVTGAVSALWPLAVWLAFGALVVVHARVLLRVDRAKNAERVYLRGQDRLAGRWHGNGVDGAAYLDGHPYAHDLDVFGRASLFELINTTRTSAGEATLAEWLGRGAEIPEVLARQRAVDELRSLLEFREDVAVLADDSSVGRTAARTGPLGKWSHAAPVRFPPALGPALAAIASVTVVLGAVIYREWLAPGWLVGWIALGALFASIWRRQFHRALHAVETPEHDLGLVVALLERVERQEFSSPRLAALRQTLITDGVMPSRRVAQLRRLVSWVDSTHNMMFAPIAYVLLLKPQLAVAIDRWHARYGPAIAEWLRVLGEIEALAALGTYAFEHPGDPFPELSVEGPLCDGIAVGHPLLLDETSVRNDVGLGGAPADPRVVVISGSNMSGKSTFLRSVGLNVVLALAGAPVRAARFRVSALVLGATLRVEDSLEAGQSRFYAEILRLRTIVDAARGPVPLLFLLDEILHGTNSFDRRIGAEGIVRALAKLGAIGFVTTHDLALTELPSKLGPVATNRHFEDRLIDGKMVFDYKMRPGVVEHSNALALMRAIGLDV